MGTRLNNIQIIFSNDYFNETSGSNLQKVLYTILTLISQDEVVVVDSLELLHESAEEESYLHLRFEKIFIKLSLIPPPSPPKK